MTLALDYDLDRERLRRRRAIADAMIAQSMQPGQVHGQFVDWASPIARVAQAYFGGQQQRAIDTEEKVLGQRQREQVAEALADYTRTVTPRASSREQIVDEQANDGEGALATIETPGYQPTMQDRQTAAARLAGAAGGDPRDMAKLIVAQAMKPETAFGKIDPKDYTPESVAAFNRTGDYSVLRPRTRVDVSGGVAFDPYGTAPGSTVGATEIERELLAAGLQRGTPEWTAAMAARVKKQTTHAPAASANVTVKQEGAEAATVGKGFGEQYVALQQGALAAQGKLNQLDRMEQLMQGVRTGTLQPTVTQVSALAATLGFKIDENLGPKQALESLSNEMALALRNPAGGAGMPGALSDKDREFLKQMTPGLGKTPEGNALILQTMRQLAKREVEVAQLARDYRQRKGQIDEGFYNELRAWSAQRPLFQAPAAGGANPEIDALVEKYGGRR